MSNQAPPRNDPLQEPIAIVGMSCLFPNAGGLKEYWRLLRRAEDAITDVPETHWKAGDYFNPDPRTPDHVYCTRGGFIPPTNFDPLEHGIPPTTLEAVDTAQLLGLVLAKKALENAGYGDTRDFDRARTGVIIGVTSAQEALIPLGARLGHPHWRRALADAGVAPQIAEDVIRRISDAYVGWQENSFPGLLGNVVAGRIANRLNLRGTNCVVDAACASSLSAIHLAALELSAHRADMIVTGGVDTFSDIFMFMCFAKTQALSRSGDARPFDAEADGTVLGEGIGIVVLKRLADAQQDGDRICAVLRGIGTSSDGRSQSIYAPRAEGQAACLRNAYKLSGVDPVTIELVEAHGTGTRVGDAVEFEALRTVFRESGEGQWCALGSVKSQIGHTKAAAGAASLVKAVLALQHRVLPPTIKINQPNPRLQIADSPFYVSKQIRPWFHQGPAPRRAGVSSFGFGGSNFHAVLEEYPTQPREPAWDGSVEIIALSAPDSAGLNAALAHWRNRATPGLSQTELGIHAAESRRGFDSAHALRLCLIVEFGADPLRLIDQAQRALRERGTATPWSLPNIFFGAGADPGKLALLFPGQGSQYVEMGRDLVCTFPESHDAIADADADAVFGGSEPLSKRLYPPPTFDESLRNQQQADLTKTHVAQPALGAVSLAMLRVLERFGIKPDAAAGHSFGELVALRAAGRIGDEALRLLARVRGKLMGEGAGDRGGMVAVQAPLEQVARLVTDEKLEVVLANRNGPTQGILSGGMDAVQRAVRACASRGWPTKILNVAAAFHSRVMQTAQDAFAALLKEIDIHPGRIPVLSNLTGTLYPNDPDEARTLLARQITNPVLFMEEIRHLYEMGVRTFVEVGPRATLTALVRSILHGGRFEAVAVDASAGRGCGIADLARVIAVLAVLGHAVDLNAWESPPDESPNAAMSVQLTGANYRDRSQSPQRSAEFAEGAPPAAFPQSLHRNAAGARVARTESESPDDAQPPRISLNREPQESAESASTAISTCCSTLDTRKSPPGPKTELVNTMRHNNGNGDSHAPSHPTDFTNNPAWGDPHNAAQAPPDCIPARTLEHAALGAPQPPEPPPRVLGSIAPSLVHEGLRAIQFLAQQTALAHQKFLESQLAAQHTIQRLVTNERMTFEIETPRTEPNHPAEAPTNIRERTDALPNVKRGAADRSRVAEAAAAPPAPMRQTAFDTRDFESVLLEIVAKLTGYPPDMLNLDMDMEADLGIDSIKRLEILAGVQERLPNAPPVDSSYMGSLRTLRNIVEYMSGPPAESATDANIAVLTEDPLGKALSGAATVAAPLTIAVAGDRPAAPIPDDTTESGIHADATRRVLRPAALPPSTAAGLLRQLGRGDVLITDDDPALSAALARRLRDIGVPARRVPLDSLIRTGAGADVAGLILLAAPARTAASLDLRADVDWAKSAFLATKTLAASLQKSANAGGAMLVGIARMDGAFGLITPPQNPLHGALAGLIKTASHEWPSVRCRTMDVAADWTSVDAVAAAIVQELDADAPLEIGLAIDSRRTIVLEERGLSVVSDVGVRPGEVIIITGGARGVTAEAAVALARAAQPTLVLLGRSPEPQAEPPWLAALTDEAQIKRALLQHEFNGAHPTPAQLESEFRRRLANREIRSTMNRITREGAAVSYHPVDVRDPAAVAGLIGEIRARIGPIRGLVHGAGVIEDRNILDKTPEQFDRVFDTKIAGLASLLDATRDDDLRFIALFSSVSGRFGRQGQADYAMANEAINKTAHCLAAARPSCRVVSIGWGPWDGGMVTPALKREFNRLGVGLIPLETGAQRLLQELAATGEDAEVEVLIGGVWEPPPSAEKRSCEPPPPQVAFERCADLATHAFLGDHVLAGRPVLPLAITFEWLAHAALHGHPGFRLHALENLRVLKGVVFGRTNLRLSFLADAPRCDEQTQRVRVEMRSGFSTVAAGSLRHASAEALLVDRLMPAPPFNPPAGLADRPFDRDAAEMYADLLFHGPTFHTIRKVNGISDMGLSAIVRTAPPPSMWMSDPLRTAWIADPLLIDAALQLGIVWCMDAAGSPCLPACIAAVRLYRDRISPGDYALHLIIRDRSSMRLCADAAIVDESGALVLDMKGIEWTIDPSLPNAFGKVAVVPAG